ncbi:MAG: class I SAM-dependent methyltransferase [Thermoproteota archaeon]
MNKRLKDRLSEFLPSQELSNIYNSFDIIGDIAILRIHKKSWKHRQIIAETIMSVHQNVQTVLAQTSPVEGDYRTRKLEFVAGEDKTITTHKEYGCLFSVDVEKTFFSPRLLYERMRVAQQVKDGEVIVNMFAGVGCFSIVIARHSQVEKVYSLDINPTAVQFMRENVKLNKVFGEVIPLQGDAKKVIQEKLCHIADRVLMPLPEKALEYLPYALLTLREGEGDIHYYGFEYGKKGEDAIRKAKLKVEGRLLGLDVDFDIPFGRVVRTTGPHWYQIALDFQVKQSGNNF